MSDVFISSFSYHVAVGSTTSEYMQVVDMRKSSVTSRSSLPRGASSCHVISSGRGWPDLTTSSPCTPLVVPSRCFRKYSCPLPDEPSRFERQTNRLRGKLTGWSG